MRLKTGGYGMAEKSMNRRRLVIIGLLFAGGLFLIGGWGFDRAGNTANIFPLWVPLLGFFMIMGGIYLWMINR